MQPETKKRLRQLLIVFGSLLIPIVFLIIRIYAIHLNDTAADFYHRNHIGYSDEEAAEIAINDLNKAIKLLTRNYVFYNNLSEIYRTRGEYTKAAEAIENFLEKKSDFYKAYLLLGIYQELDGKLSKSQESYSKYKSLKEKDRRLKRLKRRDPKDYLFQETVECIILNDYKTFEKNKAKLLKDYSNDLIFVRMVNDLDIQKRNEFLHNSLYMLYGL